MQEHFGVARDQVEHDFVISHLLLALSELRESFVFFGGTALSRTFLNGLRLSEDIDLLSIGARRAAANSIDAVTRSRLRRAFGEVGALPWLADTKRDTQPARFTIGGKQVQVQLLDGRNLVPWPTQETRVSLRYNGMDDVLFTTLSPTGFVCAKTDAWSDNTRNAPRDLYDLWALWQAGHFSAEAAETYRRLGPHGRYPSAATLPSRPPEQAAWQLALGHQCVPIVTAEEAFEAVHSGWRDAVTRARAQSGDQGL